LDAAGAEAAFRKAKALAPKNAEVRFELAELLEQVRIGDAVAEYHAIHKELGNGPHDRALAEGLLHCAKYEEALSIADSAKATVVAIAAAAALGKRDEVRRRMTGLADAARRAVLDEAARIVSRERLYPASAMLLEELSAAGDPTAAARSLMMR